MENRSFVRKQAVESAKSENPLGWFEILYCKANEENLAIPWDDNAPKAKFPKSKIRYLQEDLFNLPNDLIQAHDFVLKSYTL